MKKKPDLRWYLGESSKRKVHPRCPFATLDRCPRYYQSVLVLGLSGVATKLDPDENKRLFDKWKKTDVWPAVDEDATSSQGGKNGPSMFTNFCPEVSFERFGWFASFLARHADDIDRDLVHNHLTAQRVGLDDPRWNWNTLTPSHYTECPLYSLLSVGISEIAEERKHPKLPIGFSPVKKD